MTRIVYLSPYYFDARSCVGGGERYPVNCARAVVESSGGTCSVEILSFDQQPGQHVLQPGVTLRLLPAVKVSNPWSVVSWDLAEALIGADLVHLHQAAMRASEVALLLARQQQKPVCVTDHGSTTSTAGAFKDRLDLADCVICYSHYGATLLQTTTPIEVIKGGVDCRFFVPPVRPPARDHLLCVARIVSSKGIDRLLTALPRDLPLTVCGKVYDPEYHGYLQKLARGKRVTFVHDADDACLLRLYQTAWGTILPSVNEDWRARVVAAPELMGLTLLESMACGTPAVCSTAGAMPEFVRDGETGFVYRDLDELTERLEYLATHPAAVEQMGARARQVTEQEYSLPIIGAQLLQVYNRLLRRSPVKESAA
jgi:glycosyltransferase involved in cell wall biosynthesis